jgi:small subunit ribosomal protein S7
MPPRLYLFSAGRALPSASRWTRRSDSGAFLASVAPRRTVTADEKPHPSSDQPKGPNQDQLPHVSEEAAATGKITGEGGPDIEQGTPVEEVRDGSFPSLLPLPD